MAAERDVGLSLWAPGSPWREAPGPTHYFAPSRLWMTRAARFSAGYRRVPPTFDAAARALLLRYPWPGNVRELRNLMERIAIMHPAPEVNGTELEELLLPRTMGTSRDATAEAPTTEGHVEQWRARFRKEEAVLVEQTLQECGWNVTLAAQKLGIDRASLHRKMRRLGIDRPGR